MAFFVRANSEKMRITDGGNLLVNSTTDNGNRLQVTGNGYFSGNVGIGTSSPVLKLDVTFSNAGDGIRSYNTLSTGFADVRVGNNTTANLGYLRVGGSAIGDYTQNSFVIGTGGGYNIKFAPQDTLRATLDTSGNLGLGVTPSAWAVVGPVLQINNASFYGYQNQARVGSNAYYDGGIFKYIATDFASEYRQNSGQHQWYTAPSGTAGNAITFTQAMTLTANGRLLLGTTTEGTQRLQVVGTSYFSDSVGIATTSPATFGKLAVAVSGTGSKAGIGISNNGFNGTNASPTEISLLELFSAGGTAPTGIYSLNTYNDTSAAWLAFKTTNAAGTTSTALTLSSTGAATFSSSNYTVAKFNSSYGQSDINIQNSGTTFAVFGSGISVAPTALLDDVGIGTAGLAKSIVFATGTAYTERMRITSGGNLLVGTTTDPGSKLYLVGSSARFENTSSTFELDIYGNSNILRVASGSTSASIQTLQNNPIIFGTGASERIRLKANGSLRYIPMATPASAEAGDVYYDSTSNKLRCYNGTSWNDLF
jgi:hypothetical protein